MTRRAVSAGAVVLLVLAAACRESGSPTAPSSAPSSAPSLPPSRGAGSEPFEVAGVVTDDTGRPVPGIAVTMRHYTGGFIQSPMVLTDAAGAYQIAFSADPWNQGSSGRAAARAELIADGYEWYYRTIFATGARLVENFRLHPLRRIVSGESVVLSLASGDSECLAGLSWTPARVCRTASVKAQSPGTITVQAMSPGDASQPLLSVCCVEGDDRYGNPVTLPVTAGTEYTVEVGVLSAATTGQPITVQTSFDP